MTDWSALESAWEPARAAGALGPATLDELRTHAAGFMPAACRVRDDAVAVDLGTGVGVPGVLLALEHPAMTWRLIDASRRRCAIAEEAVRAVGIEDRVTVHHARVEDLAHDPVWREQADLAVARLFADTSEVAECGLPLVRPGGELVVSVSGATRRRWLAADLRPLAAFVEATWSTPAGDYLRVRRDEHAIEPRFPRRGPARRRSPLVAPAADCRFT